MATSTLKAPPVTKTGTMTAGEHITLSEVQVKQRGDIVCVSGYATVDTSSITRLNNTTIGTISGVTMPASTIRALMGCGDAAYSAYSPCYVNISTSGAIKATTASGTAKNVVFDLSYAV